MDPSSEAGAANGLSPGIAELRHLAKAGDVASARLAAKSFETFVPANENEWAECHGIMIKLAMRDLDEIMTVKFLERFPQAAMARLNLATIMVAGERRKEALAQLELLLARPVQTPAFWNGLARIAWGLRKWSLLAEVARSGLRLTPGSFRMHYVNAVSAWFLKPLYVSRAAFETAIDHVDGKIVPLLEIVRFCDEHGVPNIAETAFTRALELAAATRGAAHWLQILSVLQEKFVPARIDRFFECAVAAQVRDAEVLLSLFNYTCTDARPELALAIGRQLQMQNPTLTDLAERLAQLETARERPSASSETWWQALKPNPRKM